MDSRRWQQVGEILHKALELPTDDRAAFVVHACADDAELAKEVGSLLVADAQAAAFFSEPLLASCGAPRDEASPPSWVGRCLGAYRLLRLIGHGGMGSVYLAARGDDEYQRQVAVKLQQSAVASGYQIQRLRAERQILAGLDHPNIAQLYDGGTTEEGLPYLVMEYVEGQPIDEYCDERRLPIAERLRLFMAVCAAVSYAHQNLVVHRDLKPANILVTPGGTPKLLDFGIAKLLKSEPAASAPPATAAWLRVLTPDYASPEQVQGRPITTASDVYSLGVLLYKLLTGRLPRSLAGKTPQEIERCLLEQEPEKPSAAILGQAGTLCAQDRAAGPTGSGAAQQARQVAGDLDNIILKALRTDAGHRYRSVDQLAEDLRRHLAGLPVLAHPSSVGYRVAKFLRRHRVAVVAAGAAIVAIVAAGVLLALGSARVAAERDRAQRERDKARQVAKFLEEVFSDEHPAARQGLPTTPREMLDRCREKLDKMAGQPEVQAALRHTLGRIYRDLGLYDPAEQLLRESLDVRRKNEPGEPAELARNLADLAILDYHRGRYQAAEALFTESLGVARSRLGERHPIVALVTGLQGSVRYARGDYRGAEADLRQSLRLLGNLREPDRDPVEAAMMQGNLSALLEARGAYDESEALLRSALATWQERFGEDHYTTASGLYRLASLRLEKGDYPAAVAGFRAALSARLKLFGPEHPETALFQSRLALALHLDGMDAEAEALAGQAAAMHRKLLGERHWMTADSVGTYGAILRDCGRYAAARPLLEEALAIARASLGPEHPKVARALFDLAKLRAAEGDAAAAEPLFRGALAQQHKLLGPDHPEVAATLVGLAEVLVATGRAAQAEPLFREALEIRRAKLPAGHRAILELETRQRERTAVR